MEELLAEVVLIPTEVFLIRKAVSFLRFKGDTRRVNCPQFTKTLGRQLPDLEVVITERQ